MATTFRLKRKTFGVIDAARNAVGGTVETAGDILSSGVGKTAGALAGAAYAPTIMGGIGKVMGGIGGANIGASGVGSVLGKIGGSIGGAFPLLGPLAGAAVGWGATKLAGNLLKKAGQGISTD